MFCPKCGNQIEDGLSFCPNCGTPLSRPPAAPSQPFQQQAQPRQAPAQQPCPQQPYPQQAYPQQPPQPQPQPGKTRKPPVVVIAIAAVVAVAAVAAVVAFVVLPRVMPRGIWVATKGSSSLKYDKGTSTTAVTYTLDDRGNPTAVQESYTFASGSKSTVETTYDYDDKGFAKGDKRTTTDIYPGKSPSTYESTTTYQWTPGDGDMPSKLVHTKTTTTGTTTYTYSYQYDSNGHISKIVSTEKDEDTQIDFVTQSDYVSEFDGRGLGFKSTAKHSHQDDDEKMKVTENRETVDEYEYDQSNRPIKCTGTVTEMSTNKKVEDYVTTYEYDENGNVSSLKTEGTSYGDDGASKYTSTGTYEYKHVDNPTPWVAEMARLGPLSLPATFS